TKPGTNFLKDTATTPNETASWTAETVTNNVSAAPSLARHVLTINRFEAPNTSYLNIGGDFSFSGWFKMIDSSTGGVVSKRGLAGTEWSLDLSGVSDAFRFFVNGGGSSVADSGVTPTLSTFFHAYCEYDAVTDKAAVSIDDQTLVVAGAVATAPETSLEFSRIGTSVLPGPTYNVRNMHFDDLAFWNRKLTTAERTWLVAKNKFNAIGSGDGAALATNLIAWYECNEATGDLIDANGGTDYSFHHNIIAHIRRRAPRISNWEDVDVVNNIIYNWIKFLTSVNFLFNLSERILNTLFFGHDKICHGS
ncbi:hypothetical protein LCGC14_3125890, partial [marine sediment metagenome]